MTRRCCTAFLLLLALSGLTGAEDRRVDKSVLTVMTLNAEFLWDGMEPEEGQVNFPWKHSQTEAEEHMRKIAEIITRSNPDMVNLVEVENQDTLAVLTNMFLAGRGYVPYFIKGKDTYTGQDVALLTRIDPEQDRIDKDDRKGQSGNVSKSVSKNYFAKIDLGNVKFAVVGIHLLAQPLREDRRLQREAQAEAIRSLALDLKGGGYPVIVLGDFNDYDAEDESRDHVDSMPKTNVLRILRSMAPDDLADDLINACTHVPKAGRYSAFYDRNDNGNIDLPDEFTSIDHVLLSPELAALVDRVEIPHLHDPRVVTDHFPVVVSLRLSGSVPAVPTRIIIASLLPNPQGNENINEEATMENIGTQAVNLAGWTLRDLTEKTWKLDSVGILNPGDNKTIKRDGQSMALNNGGDTIVLVDPDGRIVQSVTYPRVDEGELVTPAIN